MDRGQIWRRFVINISLIIVLFLMGIFIGFITRTNRIISDQFMTTARAHFKNIVLTRRWNANHGGVFVKKEEGVVVKSNVREVDIVARYGGEELVAILPETAANDAYMAAEKLRKQVEDYEFEVPDEGRLNVTTSLGVSSLNMLAEDAVDKSRLIIKLADDALYPAKERGRNTVVLSSGRESESS